MTSIGISFPLLVQGQTCTVDVNENVVHLPHMHWAEIAELNTEYAEMVSKSQFEVARTLLANPTREVFMESRFEDQDQIDLQSRKSDIQEARKIFPLGIPSTYSAMSMEQRKYLSTNNAVETLFLLGEIKTIHKTYSSKSQAEKFDANGREIMAGFKRGEMPDSGQLNLVYRQREEAAVSEVARWQRRNPHKKVFIVYGTAHDFDKYYTNEFARAACPNSELPQKWSVTLENLKRTPASAN